MSKPRICNSSLYYLNTIVIQRIKGSSNLDEKETPFKMILREILISIFCLTIAAGFRADLREKRELFTTEPQVDLEASILYVDPDGKGEINQKYEMLGKEIMVTSDDIQAVIDYGQGKMFLKPTAEKICMVVSYAKEVKMPTIEDVKGLMGQRETKVTTQSESVKMYLESVVTEEKIALSPLSQKICGGTLEKRTVIAHANPSTTISRLPWWNWWPWHWHWFRPCPWCYHWNCVYWPWWFYYWRIPFVIMPY